MPERKYWSANGLTGAASSGPPAGRNPMRPRRPRARTSAAAELAAPRPCSAPASTRWQSQ
eukprot:1115433-Alexandrium_andersonii.AAC.1